LVTGQGNNAFVFPGIGLGVVAAGARHVTREMFLAAARVLDGEVTQASLDEGSVYPRFNVIRDVSAEIAAEVVRVACAQGLATKQVPDDALGYVRAQMYDANYES